MCKSICGADCTNCGFSEKCKGCLKTNGCPFGKQCVVAKYITTGGMEKYLEFKQKLIDEFNELQIPQMTKINELYPLLGSFVNLEYTLPSGQTVKFLDDNKIYLGNQICQNKSNRCYGLAGDENCLLVCEYGDNGSDAIILEFRVKR